MKYFLVKVAYGEGSEFNNKKSIYEYDNKNEAIGAFHSALGTAMKSDKCKDILVMVFDEKGGIYASESFVNEKYAPQTEEVVTE